MKGIGFFEKYLTVWVLLCIVLGILLGSLAGDQIAMISSLEYAHVNIPVATLIWMMIYPMMVQIDLASLKDVGQNIKGLPNRGCQLAHQALHYGTLCLCLL